MFFFSLKTPSSYCSTENASETQSTISFMTTITRSNTNNDRRNQRSKSRSRNRSRSSNRKRSRSPYRKNGSFSRNRSKSRYRSRSPLASSSRCTSRNRNRRKWRSRDRSKDRNRHVNEKSRKLNEDKSRRSKDRNGERDSKADHRKDRDLTKPLSERDVILKQWKSNYCDTQQKISEKLEEYNKKNEDIICAEKKIWTRSTPAELYYERDETNFKVFKGTSKLIETCTIFEDTLINRASRINIQKPTYIPPPRRNRARMCKHKTEVSSSDSDSSSGSFSDEEDYSMEELQRKQQHPDRLDPEMWYNDSGEMNDGPLCRCSYKSRKSGIRHGIYPGEIPIPKCSLYSNNADKLHHYRIIISPPTNFLIKAPTIIQHDEHEYIFEGFSILSHFPLPKLPPCKVIRFNIEYTILYYDEKFPENFTVAEIDLFSMLLFREVLELVDLDLIAPLDSEHCSQFHFMPRFVRELSGGGKEILCMQQVVKYLLESSEPLIKASELESMVKMSQYEWQHFADEIKGMVVTYPGKKPSSVRVDQLDRNIDLQKEGDYKFPEIVHFGIRPPQLSYAGKAN